MTNPGGLWKVEFGELGAILKALQDHGATLEDLARLRSDPAYAKRVAEHMRRGGLEGPIDARIARAAVGSKYFFGVESWATCYGSRFSPKQLCAIPAFPWSEDVLMASCPFNPGRLIRDTHVAFLVPEQFNKDALTIMKLQQMHPATAQPKFSSYAPDSWYTSEDFATKISLGLRWYLLLANIVPNSTSKPYVDQEKMLPLEYEIPFAVEEMAKNLLWSKQNGTFLNPTVYARVKDVASSGLRVSVGRCDARGIGVVRWDDGGVSDVGVAASRKVPART